MPELKIEYWPIDRLVFYARNPRKNEHAVPKMASLIKEFGFKVPVVARSDGSVVDGHLRLMAARHLGMETVPVVLADEWTPAQVKAFRIAVNKSAELAEWDTSLLALEIEDLKELDFDLELTGFELPELDEIIKGGMQDGASPQSTEPQVTRLADRFGYPPFSVLNARDGVWQERKRQWIKFGVDSGEGRSEDIIGGGGLKQLESKMANSEAYLGRLNNRTQKQSFEAQNNSNLYGTSIFDPVLCELAYQWFCPPHGTILDPFAGGSVRGIVAAQLGREYVGVDLRQEQVEANRRQAEKLCNGVMPTWRVGNSIHIDAIARGEYDFVFSCPPYADLERYSNDPEDISTMPYPQFLEAYRQIVAKSCSMLKQDAFSCFVVGEVREKDGNYYGLVPDTIQAFKDAGLEFYNEIILVTSAGTLPLRVGKFFDASRKVGKCHQNVLVFVKGDAFKATKKLGPVEVSDLVSGLESEDA